MRETISYKKNFKEGTEEYTKKYKPDNPIARGIATIQLYEGDNLVEEYKDENIITDYTKRLAYMDYFYYRLKGSTTGGDKNFTAPFNVISLTNNTEEEKADINLLLGDVIGWANKIGTYAGSSTTQGTRNDSETSFYTDDNGNYVAHFVFDFPTHCANGTFNSIYWHVNHNYSAITLDTKELGSNYGGFYVYEDNSRPTLLTCGATQSSDTGSSIFYSPRYTVVSEDGFGEFKSLPVSGLKSTIMGYSKEGKLLCLQMEYSGGVCNLYDMETNGLLKTFSIPSYNQGELSYVTGIIHNGVAVIQHHIRIQDKITVLDLDSIGNSSVIADVPVITAPNSTAKGICILDGKVYLLRKDNIWYEVDIESRTLKSSNYRGINLNNYVHHPFTVLKRDLDGVVYNYEYSSSTVNSGIGMYKRKKIAIVSDKGIGAYNKLSSPVTKTAVNTMKIQYDFIIEPVQTYQ